jgi:hypothetical protein
MLRIHLVSHLAAYQFCFLLGAGVMLCQGVHLSAFWVFLPVWTLIAYAVVVNGALGGIIKFVTK